MPQKHIATLIYIIEEINKNSVSRYIESATEAHSELDEDGEIKLFMSSPGGDVGAAFALYYHLRSLGRKITTYNIGDVSSAAVIAYLAGDERLAATYSHFLLHSASGTVDIQGNVNSAALREAADIFDSNINRYIGIFNDRTKGAENPLNITECLNGKHAVLSVDAAWCAGIVTTIEIGPIVLSGTKFIH